MDRESWTILGFFVFMLLMLLLRALGVLSTQFRHVVTLLVLVYLTWQYIWPAVKYYRTPPDKWYGIWIEDK